MKKLVLFVVIMAALSTLVAQETFFPTREGTVLVYKTFDKKAKETGTLRYTIKDVNIDGDNMDITYLCESMDQKSNPVYNEEITIHKKGNVLYLDMSNLINKAAFQQEGEIPAEIKITGNKMEIPSNPQPGDILPDASVEMALKLGIVNMRMAAEVTNRKVEAIEDISVPAGSFNCYRFSSDINSIALGIKVNTKSKEWYAKGIGTVKSESYDKKGKLQSYTILTEMN